MKKISTTLLMALSLFVFSFSAQASVNERESSWNNWFVSCIEWVKEEFGNRDWDWGNLNREQKSELFSGIQENCFVGCGGHSGPRQVPEIDGASLPLALGLLAGIFGLVRERRAKTAK